MRDKLFTCSMKGDQKAWNLFLYLPLLYHSQHFWDTFSSFIFRSQYFQLQSRCLVFSDFAHSLVKVCVYFTVDHLSHFCSMTLRMNCDYISAKCICLNFLWLFLFLIFISTKSFAHLSVAPLFAQLCLFSLSLFSLSCYALQADVRWILTELEGLSGKSAPNPRKQINTHFWNLTSCLFFQSPDKE